VVGRQEFRRVPFHHRHSVGQIFLVVSLVLSAATSLRGASRVIDIFMRVVPLPLPLVPCSYWTGRFWLLRLGYYKLTCPKEKANDWVWILDHTMQIGAEKCLLILGLRLSQLPPVGTSVCHADVEPIELLPVTKSNGAIVWQQLEQAVEKTGVPREIVSDQGSDLCAGIRQFCEAHSLTCWISDITHKAANLLKHRLESDEMWQQFTARAAKSKSQIQQTALAYLRAPKQQSKARFMNVDKLVTWGWNLLSLLEQRGGEGAPTGEQTPQELTAKLGWILEFREPLEEWNELIQLIDITERLVREEGLHHETPGLLEHRLNALNVSVGAQTLRDELLKFVREQCVKARPQERLLGSSEVIESVFGKVKRLEQAQANNGFTGLILSAAAMVSETTMEVIYQAMEHVSTKTVLDWCQKNFGKSVQAQRKEAFAHVQSIGTKMGST
jgi:hypothetical protein